MGGLVGYASSEEESGDEQTHIQAPLPSKQTQPPQPKPSQPTGAIKLKPVDSEAKILQEQPGASPSPAPGAALASPPPPQNTAPLGPSLPPMEASTVSTVALPGPSDDNTVDAPSSPYTTTRSLIHDLTLPTIPNFDIPASPPGSPPPTAAATNAKFTQFLNLKKKGTHFNAKLEQSSALRNPALTDKLLQFVDIPPPRSPVVSGSNGKSAAQQQQQKEGGGGGGGGSEDDNNNNTIISLQYQTTLSHDVWNPAAFPDWAFRDRLRRTRDTVAKEREVMRAAPGRSSVDFVSGTTTTTVSGVGGLSKGERRKGGWQ